jgi:hypothetical protein
MKKILVWRQTVNNNNNIFSGTIIVDESEYLFWLQLLNKQDMPFEINLNSHKEDTLLFENGQELIDNVEVTTLDVSTEIILKSLIGNGIGIINFYTDVISDLDNSDFIIDMDSDDLDDLTEI